MTLASVSKQPASDYRSPPPAWSAGSGGARRCASRSQASGVTTRLRGVSAPSARVAWASGAGGTVLLTTDGGASLAAAPVPGAEALDFRDVDAFDERIAYVLSIGPGEASRIFKTRDGGASWDEQFRNRDPKAFLDAMAFWDESHGIAVSDSVEGRFVILLTQDAGRHWTRVPAEALPEALPNEGAFAASGTNVAVLGRDLAWFATTAGRVLRTRRPRPHLECRDDAAARGPERRDLLDRVPRRRARGRGRRATTRRRPRRSTTSRGATTAGSPGSQQPAFRASGRSWRIGRRATTRSGSRSDRREATSRATTAAAGRRSRLPAATRSASAATGRRATASARRAASRASTWGRTDMAEHDRPPGA